jgi:DNA integrity scanning protein DisA with diadenylate cyclase activity
MVSSSQTQLFTMLQIATQLVKASQADGLLILLEEIVDWKKLGQFAAKVEAFVVATNEVNVFEAATSSGLNSVLLDRPSASLQNQLTHALVSSVAQEFISSGSTIVTLFGWFDQDAIDSISLLKLTERLGRLSAADLRKLKTEVPLETLRTVVDLAVEIGREGREGKPIGALFVVGDHRKVLRHSRQSGFDLAKGYSRAERNLLDPKIHENVKELAQLDGAFVVNADGTIEACGRIIDTLPVEVTMTRGLGARHFAAAAISKNTKAIAVVVSQSGGTVRIYQDGEVVLRIESLARPMKWKATQPDANIDE